MSGATFFVVGGFVLAGAVTLERLRRPQRERVCTIALPFCTIRVPEEWNHTTSRPGHTFVDPSGERTLLVQELTYPKGQVATLDDVLAFVVGQTREIALHTLTDARLGPVTHEKCGEVSIAYYGGIAHGRDVATLFEGLAGRPVPSGGYRFVNLRLRDARRTEMAEIVADGTALLRALVVSDAPLPSHASRRESHGGR